MNPAPELSIVIVNWNTRELLLKLLARLFDQPTMPFEAIVIDNLSGDDSVAAARAAFPQARVLPQDENGGFAFGVNRGLEAARGHWVLLLNTDAEADWQALTQFVHEAEQHPKAAVFGPRIVDEHDQTQRSTWRRHLPRHYLPEALFLDRIFGNNQRANDRDDEGDVDCVSGCVFLIRRNVFDDVQGFDERFFMYYEEADFCGRVRAAGHSVRYLPSTSFVHVGGLSAAQSAEKTFLAYRESNLLYHAPWHGRMWTEYVRLCLVLAHVVRLGIWLAMWPLGRRGKRSKLGLYTAALKQLLRPGYVGELCRRPRQTPAIASGTADTPCGADSQTHA
ncbi:MAG: glycosyltransferase family 2 protein [Planctomycetota bacterium]